MTRIGTAALAALLVVGACASTPTGPTVRVMPPDGKPLGMFEDDDTVCRHHAAEQVAGQAEHANWMQVAVAGGGTLLGAGLGAAIGGGQGAAIGAGAGALGGTAVSAIPSGKAQGTIQSQYDNSYAQCMYSRGNEVAGIPTHTHARGRR